jgi:HEAT repeat protein
MRRDGERLVRAEAIGATAPPAPKQAGQLDEIARTDPDPVMRFRDKRARAVAGRGGATDLLPALRDPDFTVATAAVEAIGAQAYKAGATAVMEAYRARPERAFVDVQLEAVRVLGDLGALEAQSLLVEATAHEDVRVRVAAVESLKNSA